ncbi:transcriptional regulator [Streptomyces sp. NPDC058637]|uniref:helix-turn-helix transcriptional regulator n=1 Tax=Streptomyces sp. NPDC058637 TaxID=3346569 RepID=UPI0036577138
MQGSEPNETEADAILAAVAAGVDGIAATVGDHCEVLVHDYRSPESSVVAVGGSVTGRRAGDPMSEIGRRMHAAGDAAQPDINYRNRTPDGRMIRSSTIPLRDSGGRVIGCLCINVDTTALHTLRDQLDTMLGGSGPETVPTTDFPSSFDAALDEILLYEARSRDKELTDLTTAERGEVLRRIDERGLLQARGAVRRISTRLGVSRAAVYKTLKAGHGRD